MTTAQTALDIRNLTVSVGEKRILNGVSVAVRKGEVHAVMGPNGSGKSTLTLAAMGHPGYAVGVGSTIRVAGKNVTGMPAEDRARAGLFLAFQAPMAIPGVTVMNLLRAAFQARNPSDEKPRGRAPSATIGGMAVSDFMKRVRSTAASLAIDPTLLSRGVNDGFSGGERKKIELLQAMVLAPKAAMFDEIDTGLDVDALKVVARGIRSLADAGCGVIVVTHYQRILKYLSPDAVHVLVKGAIAEDGGPELAKRIEEEGYRNYTV